MAASEAPQIQASSRRASVELRKKQVRTSMCTPSQPSRNEVGRSLLALSHRDALNKRRCDRRDGRAAHVAKLAANSEHRLYAQRIRNLITPFLLSARSQSLAGGKVAVHVVSLILDSAAVSQVNIPTARALTRFLPIF